MKALQTTQITKCAHNFTVQSFKKEGWKTEYQILQKMRVGLRIDFWSFPSSEID